MLYGMVGPYERKMAELGAKDRKRQLEGVPKSPPKNMPGNIEDFAGNVETLTGAGALLAQIVGRSNPWIQGGLAALSVGGSLFDYFHTSDTEERLQGIYDGLWERRTRLMDESQGIFSSARQDQILQANEPRLNAVSGQLAAAGLGTSGAGASVLAQVTSDTFRQAQQDAFAQLDVTERNIITVGEKLSSEIPSLGGIFTKLLTNVVQLGADVPEIGDFLGLLSEVEGSDGQS